MSTEKTPIEIARDRPPGHVDDVVLDDASAEELLYLVRKAAADLRAALDRLKAERGGEE